MSERLSNCPFCGGKVMTVAERTAPVDSTLGYFRFKVCCSNCGAERAVDFEEMEKIEQKAIIAQNKRVPDTNAGKIEEQEV